MTRRLTTADIHPSIFVAMRTVSSTTKVSETGAVYVSQAYSNWSTIWSKQYWREMLAWFVSLIPVIAIPIASKRVLGSPWSGVLLIVLMALWFAVAVVGYKSTQTRVTWDEIEAIRPILDISQNQSLYLDCVKAVLESRHLEESQRQSWLASLNASLDQAIELEKLYADMRETIGGSTAMELAKERERIEERMLQTNDATSREIYRQSLELADDRLRSSNAIASQVERAEAHLELTRLTFTRTKETLHELEIGTKQSTRIDLEPLRANLARVQDDAHAIRAAIDELAQLRLEA